MTAEVCSMYPAVDHVVAVTHPFAKNGHRGQEDLADLQNNFGLHVRPVITTPDRDETVSLIANAIEPDSLVLILGGDGTVNSTARAFMESEHDPLMIATHSGNACDFARATNGRNSASDVYTMSRFNRKAVLHRRIAPMLLQVTSPDRARVTRELAMNYAGFGFTALSSLLLNEPWHSNLQSPTAQRAHRLVRETGILIEAARRSPRVAGTINGQSYYGGDVSIVHTRRMAKVARPPITHYDKELLVAVTNEGLPANTYAMARLMLGLSVGQRRTAIDMTVDSATVGHVDAEPFMIDPNTHINIQLAEKGVRVLTAK